MSEILLVGGPVDGRRVELPARGLGELKAAVDAVGVESAEYFAVAGLEGRVYRHESLMPSEVLDVLIRRYPNPLRP